MAKKIDLMHRLFGKKPGLCKDCVHLVRKIHSRTYQKCEVYGDSNSEGTDWKISNLACGLYPDVPYKGRRVIEIAKRQPRDKAEKLSDGQIKMEV